MKESCPKNSPPPPPPSILILGASTRTGMECIHQLSKVQRSKRIHAFIDENCDDIPLAYRKKCDSVVYDGSLDHAVDIHEALEETRATWVILAVEQERSTIAERVVYVLQRSQFRSVQVVCISRLGTRVDRSPSCLCYCGDSADFQYQEQALVPILDRTVLIRTTRIVDGKGKVGHERLSHNKRVAPWRRTDRACVAAVIAEEIMYRTIPSNGDCGSSRSIHLTS